MSLSGEPTLYPRIGEMFKEKIGVKVVKQGLMKILVEHINGDYELTTILKQIGELMDDLYLAGVTTRDVMNEYLANAINS